MELMILTEGEDKIAQTTKCLKPHYYHQICLEKHINRCETNGCPYCNTELMISDLKIIP